MKRTTFILVLVGCVVASAMVVVSAMQSAPQLTRDGEGTYHYGSATIRASATRPAEMVPGSYRRVIIDTDGSMTYLDISGGDVPYSVSDQIRIQHASQENRVVL